MRLYRVAPAIPGGSDQAFINRREQACIDPIARLILSHLSDDPALFGMRHANESSNGPIVPDTHYGYAEVARIANKEDLLHILRRCGDPNSGEWMLIRSLVTCRSVFYGHDGQAFVCLPTTAPPIVSPDETFISVEECSHLLLETDLLDGLADD